MGPPRRGRRVRATVPRLQSAYAAFAVPGRSSALAQRISAFARRLLRPASLPWRARSALSRAAWRVASPPSRTAWRPASPLSRIRFARSLAGCTRCLLCLLDGAAGGFAQLGEAPLGLRTELLESALPVLRPPRRSATRRGGRLRAAAQPQPRSRAGQCWPSVQLPQRTRAACAHRRCRTGRTGQANRNTAATRARLRSVNLAAVIAPVNGTSEVSRWRWNAAQQHGCR